MFNNNLDENVVQYLEDDLMKILLIRGRNLEKNPQAIMTSKNLIRSFN